MIESLLKAGAETDPVYRPSHISSSVNSSNSSSSSSSTGNIGSQAGMLSPLTLVLQRGAAAAGAARVQSGQSSSMLNLSLSRDGGSSSNNLNTSRGNNGLGGVSQAQAGVDDTALHLDDSFDGVADSNQSVDKGRSGGRRVWVRAAETLVRAGARWDPALRIGAKHHSQLYLLVSGFPPAKEDSAAYRYIIESALAARCDPLLEDEKGRNMIFFLCEQMAFVPAETCPESRKILSAMLGVCGSSGVGGSDRTGRTVFDIDERVANSCLGARRHCYPMSILIVFSATLFSMT